MKTLPLIRTLFVIAGIYDACLGLAFVIAAPSVYHATGMPPPSHWGYAHFPAGLLVVFGIMFFAIALRPIENRNLIVYGVLLKVCYVATIGWHWYFGGVSYLWKYFAVADTVFAVLFAWSIVALKNLPRAEVSASPMPARPPGVHA